MGFTINILVAMLEYTISEFNVPRTATGEQLVSCARDIVDEFPQFNLFDIKTCLKKATLGYYGNTYSTIDKPTIFGWLKQYEQEKADIVIQYNTNKAGEFTKENKEILGKVDFKIPDYQPKTYDVKENPYQKYFQEFDKLFREIEDPPSGMRFIEYEGKRMSQEEFVTYRFTQDKQP